MRDHSHHYADNSNVCEHCGQPLPTVTLQPHYGDKRTSRTGLAVTIGLHLLLVAIYFIQPHRTQKEAKPSGSPIVWVAPDVGKPKPKPQEQAPKKTEKTPKKPAPERVQVQRLPNTITLPNEKPVEVQKPVAKPELPPEATDMASLIEARRKQRGAQTPDAPAEESENAKAMRNAMNNIAAINGRSRDDKNETGGVFSVANKSFSSADLKFRGWNPNFKRRWLTQVTVELGSEPDIETAIVKKMIELIRKEKTGDFEWDSHRLGRVVTMSARPKDTEELTAFLFKEMFPEYKPPRK